MPKKTVVIGAVCALAVTVPLAGATSVGAVEFHDRISAELATRVGTQSPAEIDRILRGGGEVEALVDPTTGVVLAAHRTSWRSIVQPD